MVLYALCGALLWNVAVRPGEEDALEARFGLAYRRYKAATPLWLLSLSAYCGSGDE